MGRDWSKLLGEPGKGPHTHFFGIAIFDVFLTFLLAFLFHYIYPKYSFWVYLISLFIIGIILHRLLGVKTTVDKLLFGN
jgi:hypothetical protein